MSGKPKQTVTTYQSHCSLHCPLHCHYQLRIWFSICLGVDSIPARSVGIFPLQDARLSTKPSHQTTSFFEWSLWWIWEDYQFSKVCEIRCLLNTYMWSRPVSEVRNAKILLPVIVKSSMLLPWAWILCEHVEIFCFVLSIFVRPLLRKHKLTLTNSAPDSMYSILPWMKTCSRSVYE